MKINEIIAADPRDGYIKEYEYKFDNIEGTPAFDSLILKVKKDEFNDILLGLFDGDELVSYLKVDYDRFPSMYSVEYSLTADQYQNKGCFKYLLTTVVNMTPDGVLSDETQTPHARNAWKSLIKQGKNIVVYDKNSKQEFPVSTINDNKLWNLKNDNHLLLYFKKS